MQLLIGNKNYSSWSLRPWLGMKVAGVDFEEVLIPLFRPESRAEVLRYSPTGKVPALVDGDLVVWESLAIAEYIAESHPQLWPAQWEARALARAVCAEMHAGFTTLRTLCPMDARARKTVEMTEPLRADIQRIQQLWADCRARFGAGGPWLFGAFSWADAFFAPVVLRFVSYGIDVDDPARAYIETMLALPELQAWLQAAEKEPWNLP